MSCEGCQESGPEVDESSLECGECGLTETDCVVTSEASTCFNYGIGATLTKVLNKICEQFKKIIKRLDNLESSEGSETTSSCCENYETTFITEETEESTTNWFYYSSNWTEAADDNYAVNNQLYRYQKVGEDLLRLEYTIEPQCLDLGLAEVSITGDMLCITRDLSFIETYLNNTFSKTLDTPNTQNSIRQPNTFTIDVNGDAVGDNYYATYEDLSSKFSINDNQLTNYFTLNNEVAELLVGADFYIGGTVYLPIKDM